MARTRAVRLLGVALAVLGGGALARADSAICTFDFATTTQATRPHGRWRWSEATSLAASTIAPLWRATARFKRGTNVGTLAWTQMAEPLSSGAAIVARGAASFSISSVDRDGSLHAMTVSTVRGLDGRHAAAFVVQGGTAASLSVAHYRGSCQVAVEALAER